MNTRTKTVKRAIVSLKLPVSVPALLHDPQGVGFAGQST
jgi:hypothetical protein